MILTFHHCYPKLLTMCLNAFINCQTFWNVCIYFLIALNDLTICAVRTKVPAIARKLRNPFRLPPRRCSQERWIRRLITRFQGRWTAAEQSSFFLSLPRRRRLKRPAPSPLPPKWPDVTRPAARNASIPPWHPEKHPVRSRGSRDIIPFDDIIKPELAYCFS